MKKTKFIKIFLCILLTIGTTLFVCDKSDIVHANTHTLHTVTSFGFIDHHAYVNVDFTGYGNAVKLRIDIRIEKQFMFFNQTLHSQSYETTGESYQNEFFYPIYQDGAYNCTVTYTVTDSEGVEDVIIFRDTQAYINDEHTEHTHVWNHERTEPTYLKTGLERKFCYCGKIESTVLEKIAALPDTEYEKQPISSGAFSGSAPLCGQPNPPVSTYTPTNQGSYSTGFGLQNTQQCNCPFCQLDRSLPDPQPTLPKGPSLPTVDPWKKQQEAYMNRNNYLRPCQTNPRSPLY